MQINEFSKPRSSKKLIESAAKQFGTTINVANLSVKQLQEALSKLTADLNKIERTQGYDVVLENRNYQRGRAIQNIIEAAIEERLLDESSVILEGEEERAALIMSSRDIVDKISGWLEDVASLKAETFLELLDSIRDELGSETSQAFADKVKPALEELYTTLETNRQVMAQAVAIITGEEAPTMGAEGAPAPAPGEVEAAPEMDMGAEMPAGDEFGAAAPAAGGTEAEGRVKRESIERTKKKV